MTHDRPTLPCLSSRSGEFDKSLERVTIQRPRTTETRRINGNDSTGERTSDDREVSTGRTQAWPQQNRRPGRITPLANRQTADQPLVHDCSLSACCPLLERRTDPWRGEYCLRSHDVRCRFLCIGEVRCRLLGQTNGRPRESATTLRRGRLVDPLHGPRTERCFKPRRRGSVTPRTSDRARRSRRGDCGSSPLCSPRCPAAGGDQRVAPPCSCRPGLGATMSGWVMTQTVTGRGLLS